VPFLDKAVTIDSKSPRIFALTLHFINRRKMQAENSTSNVPQYSNVFPTPLPQMLPAFNWPPYMPQQVTGVKPTTQVSIHPP